MVQKNIYNLQVGDTVIFTNEYNYTSTLSIIRINNKSVWSGAQIEGGYVSRQSWNSINQLIKDGAKIIRK